MLVYLYMFSSQYFQERLVNASIFQVLIQESGERRIVGVGVVYQGYNCHCMPGWVDGTVGYHADDGKIFEPRHHKSGREVTRGKPIKRGDMHGFRSPPGPALSPRRDDMLNN